MKTNKTYSNVALIMLATVLTAALTACGGGGGGSGSGSTTESVVARGVITQLGSIWVNGVEWETPNGGSYSSDDSTSSVANYQVGQVVSIRGRRNDDGVTGVADEVEYEAEIEGQALGGKINGVSIIMGSTVPSGTTLTDNDRYEVSGVWIDDNTLEATFIKHDDDGDLEDEIKGYVKNLGAGSFGIRDITFNGYSGSPALSDDDLVEVHFDPATCLGSPLTCTLTSVELEDDYFDHAEGMEVEIEGGVNLVPSNCPAEADIEVDGVCVDSSSAEYLDGLIDFDSLAQGSRVEAEGHMIAATPRDYMRADKIKGRGNRVRIASIAENVVAGPPCTFTLVDSKISVEVLDCDSAFDGDFSGGGPLDIGNLDGEEVEVRGVRTGPNSMMALRVKESGLSGGGSRHEVRAEVDPDGADITNGRLTVMGIVSEADSCTELEIDDMVISGNEVCDTTPAKIDDFLRQVDVDDNAGNGPRSVVEIGFEIPNSGSGTSMTPYIAEEWEIEEEDD